MCSSSGFDASRDSERTFLMDLLPKFVKDLSTFPKTFYPVEQTIKVNWAS